MFGFNCASFYALLSVKLKITPFWGYLFLRATTYSVVSFLDEAFVRDECSKRDLCWIWRNPWRLCPLDYTHMGTYWHHILVGTSNRILSILFGATYTPCQGDLHLLKLGNYFKKSHWDWDSNPIPLKCQLRLLGYSASPIFHFHSLISLTLKRMREVTKKVYQKTFRVWLREIVRT